MQIASIVDSATSYAERAGDYPVLAQALFVATLALTLVSLLVYAVLFPRERPAETPPPRQEPS
jgi:hypothetical protein